MKQTHELRSRSWRGIGLILTVFLVTSACSLLPREDDPLAPPLVEPVQINETTTEVETGSIQLTLSGPGTLESTRKVYHQLSESGGRITEVFARAGDQVQQGDLLIQLDDSGLDLELLNARIEAKKKQKEAREALESQDIDQIEIAALELQLAETKLQRAQERLESTRIRSQMDGIITFMSTLKPGDYVDAFTTLAIVSDPNQLRLVYNNSLQNQNLSDVQVGMKVNLEYKGSKLTGTVVQTPRSAPFTEDERLRDEYSRTLYIEVDDMPEDAEPGDQMNMHIILAEKEDVVVIPKTAVRNMFGRTYVQVLEDGKRRELDVEVGIETSTEAEIINGLEPGQIVVLR